MTFPLRGFILDMDGTIYLSDRALPGAVETIAILRERGFKVVFISNKPLEPGSAYAAKLTRLGIPTAPEDVITSGYVLSTYLARVAPGARVFVIGEPPLLEEMRQAGLRLTEEPAQTDYVVAAFDRTFDYRKWNIGFQAIKFHGAHFVATNPDRTCPIDGGELPDCAGVIAALEATTGKKVELIAGKPSPMMIQAAAERIGVPVNQCQVVGDRLETDMVMGRKAGARTALVLTGVTRREHLSSAPVQPDYVLENIGGLLDLLTD
jgi:phosphoglycolate/pyridoxal phosphate phosphatase family enzyme